MSDVPSDVGEKRPSEGAMTAPRSLRVVLIPSAFSPSVGGVEELTRALAVVLEARGVTVEIWTSLASGPGLAAREQVGGLAVRRFDFVLPSAHPRAALRWARDRSRTLRELAMAHAEFQPDVLHVICFGPNGVYATALARLTRTPLIVTLQGETVMDDHDIYDRSRFLRHGLRRGLAHAAQVTACSQFTLDDARRFGVDPHTSAVVFNATTPSEIEPEPVSVPFSRYVLGLGRIVHKKGFDLLLDAFVHVHAAHPDVGLVIGGRGSELDMLRQHAESKGLRDSVHFTGVLGRAQVAGVMAGAAVFVMPSRVEPFGIVALEGWRAGVPVVVTSRGGAPEFVRDGVDGLVADPYDASRLSGAISRLLDDPELCRTTVASGSARLSEFTWDAIAERYLDLYGLLSSPAVS